MNIALDASNLARREPTGIAVYGINLIDRIARLDRENGYYLCYRLSRWRERRFFYKVPQANFHTKIIQEPWNIWFTRKIDLFHGLDARMYDSKRVKNVVTIHDIPQYSNRYSGTRHPEKKLRRYRKIMAMADRIIAISEYTKSDILRFFPIREDRIEVIPLGVDQALRRMPEEETHAVLRRYGIRPPYLLHVGRVERKKNLCRSLEAFARVKRKLDIPTQFVLAGSLGPGGDEVLRSVERLDLGDEVRWIGYVRQGDLPCLYSGALLFLFPSLYEGFGMPVLEAMACGTPVITSNGTSLPEVAGDAAVCVDPLDVTSIADGVLGLCQDPALREAYIRKGFERARMFSWERVARATLAVYEKTLGAC